MNQLGLILAFLAICQTSLAFRPRCFNGFSALKRPLSMSDVEGSNDLLDVVDNSSSSVDKVLDSALDFLQEKPVEEDEDDMFFDDEDDYDLATILEDSLEWKIPYDLIAHYEQQEMIDAANKPPPQMAANKAAIDAAIAKWQKHDQDRGSTEVQIAIISERILYLTAHLLKHKKDLACKRGLTALVNKRRSLLNYLFTTNQKKADEVVEALGIRFKPKGRVWDKEAKYSAFKNTKNPKAEAKKLAKKAAKRGSDAHASA